MSVKMDTAPLQRKLGYAFKNAQFLTEAVTHKSYATEQGHSCFNERLEFLGDSILSAVVAHYLYDRYPEEDEGRLSKLKAILVSRPSLTRWAKELELGSDIFVGAGEEASGGRSRPSIMANALEALIGAIYLDGGYAPAEAFIRQWLARQQDLPETDYKSQLQEIVQKKHKVPPSYTLLEEQGPDHDKTFLIAVKIFNKRLGMGSGKTKKEAEQAAARDALKGMGIL